AFRIGVRPLRQRSAVLGTFAVTSLGHRPVDGFYSVGGTTITVGLGRIAERPVVREGRIEIAPQMRLTLTFDHRVVAGAEAVDCSADIKSGLETYPPAADLVAGSSSSGASDGRPVPSRSEVGTT